MQGRNIEAVGAFRAAYPEDPGRAAAEIIRRGLPERDPPAATTAAAVTAAVAAGSPPAAADAAAMVEYVAVDGVSAGTAGTAAGEAAAAADAFEVARVAVAGDEPAAPPSEEEMLTAVEELRLSNLFATMYPGEVRLARSTIFEEEHPHFTAQWATAVVGHSFAFRKHNTPLQAV